MPERGAFSLNKGKTSRVFPDADGNSLRAHFLFYRNANFSCGKWMLYVVLAETALELVPVGLASDAQVARDAKKRGAKAEEMLLDSSKHWEAMAKLADKEKRGRPDIAHFCLLTALESVANKTDNMRVFVHTRNDQLIRISPKTRLPRIYERFTGLIEDLYQKQKITTKEGEELLAIEKDWTLEKVLGLVPEGVGKFAFDPKGAKMTPGALCEKFKAQKDACVVVGGFSHGVFASKAIDGLEKISVSTMELAAWTALGMAVFSYECGRELEPAGVENK